MSEKYEGTNLSDFFNNGSLYTKEKFIIYKSGSDGTYVLDKQELNRFINYLGFNQTKIISYCHKCKYEFPFDVEIDELHGEGYNNVYFVRQHRDETGINLSMYVNVNTGKINFEFDKIGEKYLMNYIVYLSYMFKCTNDSKHKYMMYVSITADSGTYTVTKIGQNPSMLTVKGFDFDKYKKQLKEFNAYEDYKKADLSNADHFYVGAYAYLRRIFEKMLNKFTEGKTLKDNHVDTKIEAAKDKFDPRIQGLLKKLYGILSCSIHELDEEDSKEYYEYLKAIIDIQLEYLKTENEKNEQSRKLSSIISKISTDLSGEIKGK